MYYNKIENNITGLIYNDLGTINGELGQYDEQIEYLLISIRIFEKNNYEFGVSKVYNNLAKAHFHVNQYEKAFFYAEQSLAIRLKNNDPSDIALSYCNIANMYVTIQELEQANKYLDLGLKFANISNDSSRLAQAYITKSLLLNAENKNLEAFEYEKKAIAIYEALNDFGVLSNRYIAAAFYSNMLNDTAQALMYFKKAENLALLIGNKPVLRNLYKYQADFYIQYKNYELAYEYRQKYYQYRDSMNNAEIATKIAELQTQFNLEKKDIEINKLQVEKRIRQLEIEKQKALITGNKAEAEKKQNEINLLNKNKELQDASLIQKQKELDYQKLLTTSNFQQMKIAEQEKSIKIKQLQNHKLQRNLLFGLIALLILIAALYYNRYKLKKKLEQQLSLINMRNNISENLHDDIGASLSNIGMLNQLAMNHKNNPDKMITYLEKAGEDIQHVSESISEIVWNINPKYDNLENLLIKMKRYAADMMDAKSINYEINFTENFRNFKLAMDKRRNLYLLFKEAINNLVKYSNATQVLIEIKIINQLLDLIITDNGIGFDSEKVQLGNGINNMYKRANELQGSFHIDSILNKGTTIHLNFQFT